MANAYANGSLNPESLRQLIANCRRGDKRSMGFPRDWSPHRIPNPEFEGYYFTEAAAWEFVAAKLELGHPYDVIALDCPKGALAIVMEVCIKQTHPSIYIKIQIGVGNRPIGRSFHFSDYT